MINPNDNAFPQFDEALDLKEDGLSKREYFAVQCTAALISLACVSTEEAVSNGVTAADCLMN